MRTEELWTIRKTNSGAMKLWNLSQGGETGQLWSYEACSRTMRTIIIIIIIMIVVVVVVVVAVVVVVVVVAAVVVVIVVVVIIIIIIVVEPVREW